jgi:hypothetical protein
MADIDAFAADLLEESKRFLEKCKSSEDKSARSAYLHASLLLAFSGLEAHINSVADEFVDRPEINIYDRSILIEKEIRLEMGEVKLTGLKMYPPTERFMFLYHRLSGKKLDRKAQWWGDLLESTVLRNKLTHPKEPPILTDKNVGRAIESIIAAINALFEAIYKKPLPAANLGLQSKLLF